MNCCGRGHSDITLVCVRHGEAAHNVVEKSVKEAKTAALLSDGNSHEADEIQAAVDKARKEAYTVLARPPLAFARWSVSRRSHIGRSAHVRSQVAISRVA